MATKASELYEEDFYAWTQDQAAVLRTHFRGDHRLDIEHLAEEIEDLGKSELQAVESFIEQIIAHLLKIDYSGQDRPRSHWRSEVVAFRQSVDRKISPSMRRRIKGSLAKRYERGRQIAAIGALPHEPEFGRRLPKACPYDWEVIWHRDVLAEAGVDLGDSEEPRPSRRPGKRKA